MRFGRLVVLNHSSFFSILPCLPAAPPPPRVRSLQDVGGSHAKDLTSAHPLPVRLSSNHFPKYSKVVYDPNTTSSSSLDSMSADASSSASSSHQQTRLRNLPSCPSLAWAIAKPLNKTAPSANLYKHMKSKKLQSISLFPDTRDNLFNKIDYSDHNHGLELPEHHPQHQHLGAGAGLVRRGGGGGVGSFEDPLLQQRPVDSFDVVDSPPGSSSLNAVNSNEDSVKSSVIGNQSYLSFLLRYLLSTVIVWLKLFLANTLFSGRLFPTLWFLVVFCALSFYLYKWFLVRSQSSNSAQPKRRRGPRFRRLQRWVGKLPGV